MDDLPSLLQNELNDRLFELEKRLVAGAYILNQSKCEESNLDKNLKKYKISGPLAHLKYYSQIKNAEQSLSVDSNGEIRREASDKGNKIETKSLIENHYYEEVKSNKTRMLSTLIYSIFDEKGFIMEYSPKEVMNLMETLFNVNFSDARIDGKVNIKKSSFSSVFYKVKKMRLEEYNNLKKFNHSYKELKDLASILLCESYDENNFKKLDEKELISVLPEYAELQPDELDELKIKPKIKAIELNDLINDNKNFIYPYLMRKIYSKALNKAYEKNVSIMPKEKILELIKKYSKKLRYDSFKKLEYMKSQINLMSCGKIISSALGFDFDRTIENAISGTIIESLNEKKELPIKRILALNDADKKKYSELCLNTLAEPKNISQPIAPPSDKPNLMKVQFSIPGAKQTPADNTAPKKISQPKIPQTKEELFIPPIPAKKTEISKKAPVAPKLPGSKIVLPSIIKKPSNLNNELSQSGKNEYDAPAVPKKATIPKIPQADENDLNAPPVPKRKNPQEKKAEK